MYNNYNQMNYGGYGGYPQQNMYQGYTGNPPKPPKMFNLLTAEQKRLLQDNNNKFDLALSDIEIAKAMCTHIDTQTGTIALQQQADGSYSCPICKENFRDRSEITPEKLRDAVDLATDTMQWIKTLDINHTIPEKALQEFMITLPLFAKIPTIWEMVNNDFNRIHNGWSTNYSRNSQNGFSMMNNAMAAFNMNPYQNYGGYGGYPQQPINNFGYSQQPMGSFGYQSQPQMSPSGFTAQAVNPQQVMGGYGGFPQQNMNMPNLMNNFANGGNNNYMNPNTNPLDVNFQQQQAQPQAGNFGYQQQQAGVYQQQAAPVNNDTAAQAPVQTANEVKQHKTFTV